MRWNTFMVRARNTLRAGGVQVVPAETTEALLDSMSLSSDKLHFANNDEEKCYFAKAWASWLFAAAQEPTWGRALEDEVTTSRIRNRSRSPRRPIGAGSSDYVAPFMHTAPPGYAAAASGYAPG